MQDMEDQVFTGNDKSITEKGTIHNLDFVYYYIIRMFTSFSQEIFSGTYSAIYLQSYIMISNLSALKNNYLNMSFD